MSENSFIQLAIFNGSDFVVSGTPYAQVKPLEDERYVEVTTPAETWSYGAQLLLNGSPFPKAVDLLFRVDIWIEQGTANVGVVGPDGKFIVHQMLSKFDGRTAVNLNVKSDARPSQIIVRNAGRNPAKAIIERVQVYRQTSAFFSNMAEGASRPVRSSSQSIGTPSEVGASARIDLGAEPLVSLIMTVRNGLPHLNDALESVRRQSYRNIELVVQDCLSTDGSSERIAAFEGAPVYARREADDGIGDANNRALERCRGAIIGSIDSDNLLEPHAVARAVEHFALKPEDAAAYGSVQMIAADGTDSNIFRPGQFDFLRLVTCDLVLPWSTAFFNRSVCGQSLLLDPKLKTCADYDTWLRISHLPIAFLDWVQGSTRISTMSMSCRPENYDQFCSDKIHALRNYAETCAHGPLRAALMRVGSVGIYCWAAESLKSLAPESSHLIAEFYERANAIDPSSPRVLVAAQRLF